ncbi:DUF6499 domain-containing protein [Caulobacter sp. SSI4214]|uniref:transcriptional regulator domain-containing protein n=1 Tax=Caulobacter sp. SSI4214 TaxID=2575739 RepID=UPI001F50AAA0|nr:DUF6499 domain-containing protein [Caulobacter sp. SSI4214]
MRSKAVTPDPSQWRASANYDHVDRLSASDLAWEWLRRNDAYDRDFTALLHRDISPEQDLEDFRLRWGLRFPCRSAGSAAGRSRALVTYGRYQHCYSRHGARASPDDDNSGDLTAAACI